MLSLRWSKQLHEKINSFLKLLIFNNQYNRYYIRDQRVQREGEMLTNIEHFLTVKINVLAFDAALQIKILPR